MPAPADPPAPLTSRAAAATAAPLPRVNPDFLVRRRLLDLLDRWSPVTVLLAPSGAGKAVLAVQWCAHARAAGHDVLWLDGEVDDPDAVAAALARAAGSEPGPDRAATLRRLRRDLQARPRRLAVVLNNAEPVLAAIGEELVEIVRDCREVHLVACLRRRLDPVAKALLEAETRIVGPADLRFTVEELRQLADAHGLALSTSEAQAVVDSVGGWAALLRTGLETTTGPDGRVATRWSPRHVAWFLDAVLAPSLPPSAWSALRRAALVEQPTFPAVLAATGPLDEAARTALEAIGILDPLVSSGDPVVRLPPLMRDHFRARYDETELGPARAVHERVTRFWLERAAPAPALRQAVAGADWPEAVAIVERHWWDLLVTETVTLRECVHHLPDPEVRDAPLVELVRQLLAPDVARADSARLRTTLRSLESATTAELVALDPATVSRTMDLTALALARAVARADLPTARRLADRADVVVGLLATGRPLSPSVRRVAHQVGTVRLLTGELGDAAYPLRTVTDGAVEPDLLATGAAGGLALLAALEGDRDTCALWLAHWRSGPSSPAARSLLLDLPGRTAAALEAIQGLERDDAGLLALEADLPLDHELLPLVLWVRVQHALAWGGRTRALAQVHRTRPPAARPPADSWLASLLGAGEAEVYLSQGRTAVADRLLAALDGRSVFVALARARLARMTGRSDEALHLLEPVRTTGHPYAAARIEAEVVAAWCRHDDPDAARAALASAVDLARRDRVVLPFARVPREVLVAHSSAVPDLGEVLAMLEDGGVRATYALEDELPSLTPREAAVLARLAGEDSLDGIAAALFVSRNTVKSQTASLYRKLGAGDRRQAVRRAYQLGLLE